MKVEGVLKKPDVDVELQKKELREACAEFESLFVAQILKIARASIMRSEEPDMARTIYESMFDDAVSQAIATKGIFGIADLLYEELVPLLEKKGDPT